MKCRVDQTSLVPGLVTVDVDSAQKLVPVSTQSRLQAGESQHKTQVLSHPTGNQSPQRGEGGREGGKERERDQTKI